MKMVTKAALLGAVLAAAIIAPTASSALTLVMSDAAGNLGAVDVNTGQVGYLHNMGVAYEGLAFDDLGNLYGVTATNLHQIDVIAGTASSLGAHGIPKPVGMIAFPHPGVFDAQFDVIPADLYVLESDGDVYNIAPDLSTSQIASGQITNALAFGTSDFAVGGFVWDGGWTMSVEGGFTGLNVTPGDPNFDYLTDTTTNGIGFLDQMAFDHVTAMATSASSAIIYGVSGTTIFDTATGAIISDFGGQGLGAPVGAAFATENGGRDIPLPAVPLPAALLPMLSVVGFMTYRSRRKA